jgi:hypothetical protein
VKKEEPARRKKEKKKHEELYQKDIFSLRSGYNLTNCSLNMSLKQCFQEESEDPGNRFSKDSSIPLFPDFPSQNKQKYFHEELSK